MLLRQVPPIRYQGGCGACWAFSTLAALEIQAVIGGVMPLAPDRPDLSEQQLVNCVAPPYGYRSQGCTGGYTGAYPRVSEEGGRAAAATPPAAAAAACAPADLCALCCAH
jgi:C1A family cysteine protease